MDIVQTNRISYTHVDMVAVREQIAKHNVDSSIPLFDVVSDGADELSTYLWALVSDGSN